jgi:2-desacetyl-2-hydroxyethyl bacteriochlorophyllide A dehydrogenase
MRAVTCREPGQLALIDRPEPEPRPGEVLVRIRRVGICGTDYHIYDGTQPFITYPRIMGHELSAEVVGAPAASALRPGEAVIVNPYLNCGTCIACRKGKTNCCTTLSVLGVHRDGGMTDLLALPEGNLYPAGDLSLDQAAMVEFLAIGAHAVRRSAAGPGDRALVVGAGPIGIGTALFAAIAGAEVTLLDRDAERLALAIRLTGLPDGVVADADAAEALASRTGGENFDRVFDATGSRASMEASFGHVANGGTYVLVGLTKENVGFSDPEFHRREISLLASRNATRQDFEHVVAGIRSGRVPANALATHRSTLASLPADMPGLIAARSAVVKALVTV